MSLARAALAAARAEARARGMRPTAPTSASTPATSASTPATAQGANAPQDAGPAAASAGTADASAQVFPAVSEQRASDGGASDPVPTEKGAATTTPAMARRARRPTARPGFPLQPERAEPQPLGTAINSLLDAEGWQLAAATGSVFGRWPQIVGADLAAHTQPESLSDGELMVTADSTAWATQVRLLAAQLVRRLNSELGDGTVRRVKVRGPATGTRKPGQWRVRGGRGPRDTYG